VRIPKEIGVEILFSPEFQTPFAPSLRNLFAEVLM
jgi:hypothetical protein